MLKVPVSDRASRAMKASPRNMRLQELQARAEETRRAFEAAQRRTEEAFRAWQDCDRFLHSLEDLRDAHAPKTPDEPWDDLFCMAVEMIPDYRREARELWLDYAANT